MQFPNFYVQNNPVWVDMPLKSLLLIMKKNDTHWSQKLLVSVNLARVELLVAITPRLTIGSYLWIK